MTWVADPTDAKPDDAVATAPPDDLAEALRQVGATPAFGGGREALVEALAGRTEVLQVDVERVQWTGVIGASEAYRNGRTIAGRIVGTDLALRLLVPPTQNAVADGLSEGDRVQALAAFTGWDAIYDCGRFEGELEAA